MNQSLKVLFLYHSCPRSQLWDTSFKNQKDQIKPKEKQRFINRLHFLGTSDGYSYLEISRNFKLKICRSDDAKDI